ncbi:MAG: hypothetical protein CYG59_05100 [Chloroflexi bacterium]|nr:MAG: hypothetical protein CYG59_05100 [Chloroflexota bacterium]
MPIEGGGGGDPSPMTAFGVHQAISTLADDVLSVDQLTGIRVAVQGLGKVGLALAQQLQAAGAIVIGTDIQPDRIRAAHALLGIRTVAPDAIFDVPCEIFAPCGLGGVRNERTIARLNCKIVAGCANNQLATDQDGEALHARGIVYGVDYVINAGGLINTADELHGYNEARARAKTAEIAQTVKHMLATARTQGISTHQAARQITIEILRAARQG